MNSCYFLFVSVKVAKLEGDLDLQPLSHLQLVLIWKVFHQPRDLESFLLGFGQ